MTHNKSINENLLDYPEWHKHIEQEGKIWPKWINHWIEKAKNREVPVFFCRFEDLITDPKKALSEIFGFILGTPSVEGTVIEKRIEEVLSVGKEGSIIYKPRNGGGGMNRNLHNYNQDQINYLKKCLEKEVHFFGYAKREGNPYGFFDYEGQASEESEKMFGGFQELNKKTWEWVRQEPEVVKNITIGINQGKDGFGMISEKDLTSFRDMPTRSTIKE